MKKLVLAIALASFQFGVLAVGASPVPQQPVDLSGPVALTPAVPASSSNETVVAVNMAPIPDCMPCTSATEETVVAANMAPIPDCMPCTSATEETVVAANMAPIPDCMPCKSATPDSTVSPLAGSVTRPSITAEAVDLTIRIA